MKKSKVAVASVIILSMLLLCAISFTACNNNNDENDYNPLLNAYYAVRREYEDEFLTEMNACMKLAGDNSYVRIDTNPYNISDYYNAVYELILLTFNEEIDLPYYIEEEMNRTSALDGTRTEKFGDIEVSWKYHPNRGLDVMYKYIKN